MISKSFKASVSICSSRTEYGLKAVMNHFLAWKHGHVVAAVWSRAQLWWLVYNVPVPGYGHLGVDVPLALVLPLGVPRDGSPLLQRARLPKRHRIVHKMAYKESNILDISSFYFCCFREGLVFHYSGPILSHTFLVHTAVKVWGLVKSLSVHCYGEKNTIF